MSRRQCQRENGWLSRGVVWASLRPIRRSVCRWRLRLRTPEEVRTPPRNESAQPLSGGSRNVLIEAQGGSLNSLGLAGSAQKVLQDVLDSDAEGVDISSVSGDGGYPSSLDSPHSPIATQLRSRGAFDLGVRGKQQGESEDRYGGRGGCSEADPIAAFAELSGQFFGEHRKGAWFDGWCQGEAIRP